MKSRNTMYEKLRNYYNIANPKNSQSQSQANLDRAEPWLFNK